MSTKKEEEIKEEKTICPFCLIALKDKIDWQKFFLIISGYDDIQINELSLLNDKANEILRKEVERRAGIKNYETSQPQPQPQQLPTFSQLTLPGGKQFPPNTKQFVENILLKKWADKQCPFCKKPFWIVNEQIYQLMPWQKGAALVIGGGPVQPVISVICQNCGFAPFFNAMVTGIIKPQPKPPT